MLKSRFKIDIFLRSGHTMRVEVGEYTFKIDGAGAFTSCNFKEIYGGKFSFDLKEMIGYQVVGKTYRLR